MPNYRVFYLKEDLSRRFQETAAASARKQLRQRDYTLVTEISAPSEYAAWQALQSPGAAPRRFAVGDVLEPEDGRPRLCLYGGFEEAAWWTPEAVPNQPTEAPAAPPPEPPGE